VLVAAALLASAGAKLTCQEAVVVPLTGIGVPLDWFRQPAAVEIAGAIGLLAGLFVPAIGLAAAIGVILHFIGAVSFHVRAHDTALARPVVIGLLAVPPRPPARVRLRHEDRRPDAGQSQPCASHRGLGRP
jgi:hypothetical protein